MTNEKCKMQNEQQIHTLGPCVNFAAVTTFRNSIVTVIGPTPPGTGVIQPAISFTGSKSTSPTVLNAGLPFSLSAWTPSGPRTGTRLTPTSITIAPGFTILALI